MAKCPKCRKEIKYLINQYERTTTQNLIINREGNCDWDDIKVRPVKGDRYACPECGVVIFLDYKNATNFLKSIETIKVGERGCEEEHEIGNEKCEVGWCGRTFGYPKRCECDGLIHAAFGDENRDCDYWLYTKCDKCGKEEGEPT